MKQSLGAAETGEVAEPAWAQRAADRSPVVRRYRSRGVEQAHLIVDAARRLIAQKGDAFTTQELVREAGVALQTFYRYFGGKDQLLLAVLEDMVAEGCAQFREGAASLDSPVDRLRYYVASGTSAFMVDADGNFGPRFVTSEHWRLQRLFPAEVAEATRPFTDLVLSELEEAAAAGMVEEAREYDAWLVTQLVMAVYHHYAFAPPDLSQEELVARLWSFCAAALRLPA